MKSKNLIYRILVIFIVITLIVLTIIILLDQENIEEPESISNGSIGETETKLNEFDIGDFEYGSFVLPYNETIEIGNCSFLYETQNWNIRIRNKNTNKTLCHFWRIENGSIHGLKGFQMNITSVSEYNVSVEFLHYNNTDFLGKGVFFPVEYNKTLNFNGDEIITWKDYNRTNEAAEIEVNTREENYITWIPKHTKVNLDFIKIWIRHPHGIECS